MKFKIKDFTQRMPVFFNKINLQLYPNGPIEFSHDGKIKSLATFNGHSILNSSQLKNLKGQQNKLMDEGNYYFQGKTERIVVRGQNVRQYEAGGLCIRQYYNEKTVVRHVDSGASKGINAISTSKNSWVARKFSPKFGGKGEVRFFDTSLLPYAVCQQQALIRSVMDSEDFYKTKFLSELPDRNDLEPNVFYMVFKRNGIQYAVIDPAGQPVYAQATYELCGMKGMPESVEEMAHHELAGIFGLADVRGHTRPFPVPTSGGQSVARECEVTIFKGVPEAAVLGAQRTYPFFLLGPFKFNELYVDLYSFSAGPIKFYFEQYLPAFHDFLEENFDPEQRKLLFKDENSFQKYLENEISLYQVCNKDLTFSEFKMSTKEEAELENRKYNIDQVRDFHVSKYGKPSGLTFFDQKKSSDKVPDKDISNEMDVRKMPDSFL